MFRRKKDSSDVQKAKEAKEAKEAREKKKLALFLTPNPPTPPLKKRAGRQPLKQGNAVLPRGVQQDYAKDSESSSESSSASSDTSSSSGSSSSDKSCIPVGIPGVQPRSPCTAAQVQPQGARQAGGSSRTYESRPTGVSFKQDSKEIKHKKKQKEKKAAAMPDTRLSTTALASAPKSQGKSR